MFHCYQLRIIGLKIFCSFWRDLIRSCAKQGNSGAKNRETYRTFVASSFERKLQRHTASRNSWRIVLSKKWWTKLKYHRQLELNLSSVVCFPPPVFRLRQPSHRPYWWRSVPKKDNSTLSRRRPKIARPRSMIQNQMYITGFLTSQSAWTTKKQEQ